MCRLFATKDFNQSWRSSITDLSVWEPKDTSAPLMGEMLSVLVSWVDWGREGDVRGKKASFACQDGDEDFIVSGNFDHCAGEFVIEVSIESI